MNRRANNSSRRRGTRRPQRRSRPLRPRNGNSELTIVRSPHFFPARTRTVLRFNASAAINNAGFLNASIRYRPTNAFDIDPVLGSTAVPGFTELAGIYRQYRVNNFRARISCSSLETFPVQIWACPDNADPGVNTAAFQSFISNRDGRVFFLGPATGNGIRTWRMPRTSVGSFGGTAPHTRITDAYSSLVSGGPTNNLFLAIGIVSGSAVLVNGVDVTVSFDIEIDFYELQNPST